METTGDYLFQVDLGNLKFESIATDRVTNRILAEARDLSERINASAIDCFAGDVPFEKARTGQELTGKRLANKLKQLRARGVKIQLRVKKLEFRGRTALGEGTLGQVLAEAPIKHGPSTGRKR